MEEKNMRQLTGVTTEYAKRRLFVGCISTIISIPVMCCCLFGLFNVVLPFMDNLARSGDGNTTAIVLVGGGLVALVLLLAVPVGMILIVINQRARALDAIFAPLGLRGKMYLINGRHYQGQLAGREADIYIFRGPTVELRLKTRVMTRTQFFQRDSIPVGVAGALNKHPLASLSGLEGYAVYALDEAWTRNWLADEQTVRAIQTLMAVGAEWAIFRSIEIQPGEAVLHLYRSRKLFINSIPLEATHAWLTALQTLAQSAETQPAPVVTAAPIQASSRQSRERINKIQTYAIAFIVIVMPLCFIAIGMLVFLLAWLNQ
jgi:hypothetical protein